MRLLGKRVGDEVRDRDRKQAAVTAQRRKPEGQPEWAHRTRLVSVVLRTASGSWNRL